MANKLPSNKTSISIKELLNKYIPDAATAESLGIFVAIVVGVLTVLYVLLKFSRRSSKRSGVAIIGLCEAGKTQLFSQLCYEKDVLTVTSTKESSGLCNLDEKTSTLLFDVPGHDRIRYNLFDKVKEQARAIILVLDASTIQRDLRDVAEFLYNVLCDGSVQNGKCPLLIACNKQDLPTAKGSPLIKVSLEKEMNLLRVTKANQLKSVGEAMNNNSFVGKPGVDFEFSHLSPIKVTFAETIAKGALQMDAVHDWLVRV